MKGREEEITYMGETMSIAAWARRLDITPNGLVYRLKRMSIAEALTTEVKGARGPRMLTYKGQTLSLADWCWRLGLKKSTVQNRLKGGWTVEQALGEEPRLGRIMNPSDRESIRRRLLEKLEAAVASNNPCQLEPEEARRALEYVQSTIRSKKGGKI